ncbi:Adhesion regulating molecule [Musa troglodytarum]|nr:Adhesion regulating molecule [Musa troglodytarum]
MRPVFCGNLDHDARQSELDRLFSKYGRVDRIDMKSGYAFVYFEDERDAGDAIRGLDGIPFGYSRRKLSVEWSRQGDRGPRYRDGSSKILDRVVSVEYAFRDDDDRDEMRGSPRRGGHGRRDDSPYGHSGSPGYDRGRPSPDYGHARSPVYTRYNGPSYNRSRSPDYGHHRSRSPARRS